MSNVLAVGGAQKWQNGDGVTYWVTLDDRTEDVPCYDDKAAALEVHKPLPDGWEVKKSKAGKDYLSPPRAARGGGGGGFAAAYRNTREGFEAEQDSIHRSVALKLALKYDRDFHDLYALLSGVAVATVSDNGEAQTSPSTSGGVEPDGEAGSTSSVTPCLHTMTSPLKPDGRPFAGNLVRCLDCGYVLEKTDA
jgi:hypothetical protein